VIRPRGRSNLVIGLVLFAGLVLALGLIILGGGDDATDDDAAPSSTTTTSLPTPPPGVTLPLEQLSASAVAQLTGLAFPPDMTDFLTARLDGDTQLDVTFVMPEAAVAEFIESSGLPAPTADERLVLHSSPLWKVNPDEGTTLSSTTDTTDATDATQSVRRVVELVGDGSGTIRARIVITPA
jgi:hypothetical protein